ncbi:MAG TPA: phosphatidylserine/phosphatidylglycerophosphate/cardiolipin synthase family protein [Elusimicrobiales bacterium]|nr:phosphatidylserine/phosphatidylglycerophosphate/cardiolipin synthase family protein [Elusimicrobiales bacterium]
MKKRAILKLIAVLLLSPAFTSAQTVYNSEELDAEISRTAAGLGAAAAAAPSVPKANEPAPPAGNAMPMGQKWGYLVVAYHAICAQLGDAGLLPWRDAAAGFDRISEAVLADVKNSRYAARSAGQDSLLGDAGYLRELEDLTGAKFTAGNTAEFLVNGPASFAVKDRLIREAKKSIYIASYAIYDDTTGAEVTAMLLAKKKEGVDIKVMVDDKMANTFGASKLKALRAGGVEVLRYADPQRPHDYLHVKLLIVDGKYAIIGGMNYGDPYSHKGNGLKWRDTDILYAGPAVKDSTAVFAKMWNPAIKDAARSVQVPAEADLAGGAARIAVLHHNPPTLRPVILLSIIKAMYGATRRINIENAYIVAIPAFTQAVADARARGVEVNILTNSKESIDSDGKNMADVILSSMKVFAAAGANVYLKQGQTVHSKFMTVDGIFCNVGSYNLHPRSERYDTEMNVNLADPAAVAQIDAAFAKDIAEARTLTQQERDQKKPGWLSRIVGKYFFSQLSAGK